MSKIEELADRIERLLLRYEDSQRTASQLSQQVAALTAERDSLRSRLSAARSRIDSLIERLPVESSTSTTAGQPADREGNAA